MTVIKVKRGYASSWALNNPVLAQGEVGAEIDTGQMKVGDGFTHWNDLPYTGSGAVALQSHIDSLLPHPVYDDGPNLVIIYENAKV
jgi:hypothetical protein